ncbi:MAG: hypothetical protein WBQ86_15140 [Candidatus Binatus sp.]
MFTLGDEPFFSNFAKQRNLFGGYEIALIDLSAKVRERILRFLARVESSAMPCPGLIAKIDAPAALVTFPDAPHTSMLLQSDVSLGGDLLEESSSWFGDCHFTALPASYRIGGYADGIRQCDLRPTKLLSKHANFLAGHSYT